MVILLPLIIIHSLGQNLGTGQLGEEEFIINAPNSCKAV